MAARADDRRQPKLRWVTREALEGVLEFGEWRIHVSRKVIEGRPMGANDFIALKVPAQVEQVAALVDTLQPKNIIELGVFKGGSVVLYNEIFSPEKLVAIEVEPQKPSRLNRYIRSRSAAARVSLRFGVSQADRGRLAEICASEFADQALDLVIDDASHLLFETREAFRELFPRLRPGGVYIIEDWAWAHWSDDTWQRAEDGEYFRKRVPMTTLVIELVVLSASRPDLVSQVHIDGHAVSVVRGTGQVEPGFELSECYLNRGQPRPGFMIGLHPAGGSDDPGDELSRLLQLGSREDELQAANKQVQQMLESKSWRWTAPLRVARRAIQDFRRRS